MVQIFFYIIHHSQRALLALTLCAALGVVSIPSAVQATPRLQGYTPTGDAMWDESQLCQALFPRMERQYAIPIYLLSAIAVTESGRHHKASGMRVPWPWTVQSQGKGYYFDSMEEAVAKVRSLQSRGIRNIDVGCMQVNLRYHGKHFATLSHAFDPRNNVAYAASYLTKKFRKYDSWQKALAGYHAGLASRGGHYSAKVMRAWNEVMTRSVSDTQQVAQAGGRYNHRKIRTPITAAYDPKGWNVQRAEASDVVVLHAAAVDEGYEPPTRNERALMAAALAEPERKSPFVATAAVQDDSATTTRNARNNGPLLIEAQGRVKPIRAVGYAESVGEVTEPIAFANPQNVYTAPGAPKNLSLHTIQVAQSGLTAPIKTPPASQADIWGKVRMIFRD